MFPNILQLSSYCKGLDEVYVGHETGTTSLWSTDASGVGVEGLDEKEGSDFLHAFPISTSKYEWACLCFWDLDLRNHCRLPQPSPWDGTGVLASMSTTYTYSPFATCVSSIVNVTSASSLTLPILFFCHHLQDLIPSFTFTLQFLSFFSSTEILLSPNITKVH